MKCKKILCIADRRGRIQCNRMLLFKQLMPEFDIDVFVLGEKFDISQYDLVYYTTYKLLKKYPYKQKKIASITSHKGLREKSKKDALKLLKKFDGLSVNNIYLFNEYRSIFPNVYYTPNGVDSDFFFPQKKDSINEIVLGWVGNRDRKEKNFKSIVQPLRNKFKNHPKIKIKIVAPYKKYKQDKLLTKTEMRSYYRFIHFLLITSGTEGTPNPGLEAMACGIPVLTTRVGNMTEIVKDGINGYYVDTDYKSFVRAIKNLKDISISDYSSMSVAARQSIDNGWSWNKKVENWRNFFRSFV